MHSTFTTFISICALAPQVFAGVFITAPVAGTTGKAGQSMTIQWKDDGAVPGLAGIGPCELGVYAGNPKQQTELQSIGITDVSKTTTMNFIPNATIGPNSNEYFIRVTSLNLTDPKNPPFKYEAFSAKFTLGGMSGQFSATVQSQINGITTASSNTASTPSPASSAPSTVISTTGAPTNGSVKSTASPSSTPKATASSAAVMPKINVSIFGAVSLAGALLGLSL